MSSARYGLLAAAFFVLIQCGGTPKDEKPEGGDSSVQSVTVKGYLVRKDSSVQLHFSPPIGDIDDAAAETFLEIPSAQGARPGAYDKGFMAVRLDPDTPVTIHAAGEIARMSASALAGPRVGVGSEVLDVWEVWLGNGTIGTRFTARGACLNECKANFEGDGQQELANLPVIGEACGNPGGPGPSCLETLEGAGIGAACSNLHGCVRECPSPRIAKFRYRTQDEDVVDATDLLWILNDTGAACNAIRRGISNVLDGG